MTVAADQRDRGISTELASKGVNATPDSPEAMRRAVIRDVPFWGSIARAAGVTAE